MKVLIARLITAIAVSSEFTKYPGYDGELNVSGTGGALYRGDSVWVWYDLLGLEANCESSGANGCGIHIHEGMTCADAASIGGHYYKTDSINSDPWSPIVYSSDEQGHARGKTERVVIGFGESIGGRALVVHDNTGARIACAEIFDAPWDTTFIKYPGYKGDLHVAGTGGAAYFRDAVWVWYDLSGLEAKCKSSGANGCGIHIHEGMTCTDADSIGGHYYNTDSISSDPWSLIVYSSDKQGNAWGKTERVVIGAGEDIAGRALVVHDSTGARIACAQVPMHKIFV